MSPLAAQYCAACPQHCSLHNLIQRTFFWQIWFFKNLLSFSLLWRLIFLSFQYCAACPQRCNLHTLIQRPFLAKLILSFFMIFIAFNVYLFIFSALCRLPSTLQLAHFQTKWDGCMLSVVPLAMFSIYLVSSVRSSTGHPDLLGELSKTF